MKLVYVIIGFVFITNITLLQAQSGFAILEKNKNPQAKDFSQQLNVTKDTLILNSNTLIQKVYAVNMNYEREVDLNVSATSVKIPLKNLSKGKHVFVAVQSPLRFVFAVKILGDHNTLAVLHHK